MKILYVTTVSMTINLFFAPHIKMLQDAGHTVEIACNQDEPLTDEIKALGCKSYDISFSRSPLSRQNIAAYRALKRIIADGHYDIVHTHTPVASALTRLAGREERRNGTRIFYTAHGFHFYQGAPLLSWIIYYPIEKYCSRYTDVQLTITKEDYARACRRLHAKRTVYVPGVGIDFNRIKPRKVWKHGDCRMELGIPASAKLLLSVGELNENKNHTVVLDALAELHRDDTYYVICGEGNQRPALEEKIASLGLNGHVFLLGVRSDVAEWKADADLYVHPSLREGLSVSTMEAMASALPVICGDIRGNRDLIEDGIGGLLVQPTKSQQFAAAINKLLANDALCTQMGQHNQEAVKAFSLEQVLNQLKTLYGVEI